jgi:hypothetical protein
LLGLFGCVLSDIFRCAYPALTYEIQSLEEAIPEVQKTINNDTRHINELKMLGLKFRRTSSARAVLSGLDFECCPRCTQKLPDPLPNKCPVCRQDDTDTESQDDENNVIQQDVENRISELQDAIKRHSIQLERMRFRLLELITEKQEVDREINNTMAQYDSAYLSASLTLERKKATIEQKISSLTNLLGLPRKVDELYQAASELQTEASDIRRKLDEARKSAESNRKNVTRLEEIFLDCLVRSRLPGISQQDSVEIVSPSFLPEVKDPRTGDLVITSFANWRSGGKKTIFKACFAIAMHRLAVEIGAMLPTFIIIDSSMKNIGEREDKEIFEGFHNLLYELSSSELKGTQIILIDKEFCPPPHDFDVPMSVRYMTPGESDHPPLIPYYQGK